MRFYLILCLLLGLTLNGWAQIEVQLPQLIVAKGDTIAVPVTIGDLKGAPIYSYLTTIQFRSQVLTPMSAEPLGTVSQHWTAPITRLDSLGLFKIAAYGAEPLSQAGTLVWLKFVVTGNYGDTTSLKFKKFEFNANNPSDPSAQLKSGFITIKLKPVQVTVTTNIGANTTVLVDGVAYPAPFQATWEAGSRHTLNLTSPQSNGEATRYVFVSWGDGGAQNHTVAPLADITYTATLTTQYRVTVNSQYGTPQGGGWYQAGRDATISVNSPVSQAANSQYVFTRWEGTGTGAYSGTSNPVVVKVNAPLVETARWKKQFNLLVNTNPENLTLISGSGWYDQNATATTGKAPESVGTGANQKQLVTWRLDYKEIAGNPLTITMDTSHVATAWYLDVLQVKVTTNFEKMTQLSVDGQLSTTPVIFNWAKGSTHTLSVPESQQEKDGRRFYFKNWSDGGAREHTLTVTTDSTLTAYLEKQFTLTIASQPTNLPGVAANFWYAAGNSAPVTVPNQVTHQNTNFSFLRWQFLQQWHEENPIVVKMDTAKSLTACYLADLFIHGTLTLQNAALAQMKIFLTGKQQDSTITTATGEFVFQHLPPGDYQLKPALSGLTFEPPTLTFQLAQNQKHWDLKAFDKTPPEIQVLTPNRPDSLLQGQHYVIRWRATDNYQLDSVWVFFSADNGDTWEPLVAGSDTVTSYEWMVPELVSATCLIQITARDIFGNTAVDRSDYCFLIRNASGVDHGPADAVHAFRLHQNYPNPFNPVTGIEFELPRAGWTEILIFNLSGQLVTTLYKGYLTTGFHHFKWHAEPLPSGIYFCQLQSGREKAFRRMVLIK